ncbi:unnamed protein product [Moneuplotes crassus]|uniref:Uncharacterized protein n=1 Tax=Euplotes crassus TaxID=5936 RepID=A0AAD2D5C5_EUPCR|nr:unnamed protein product [Moneuplotes crassus]
MYPNKRQLPEGPPSYDRMRATYINESATKPRNTQGGYDESIHYSAPKRSFKKQFRSPMGTQHNKPGYGSNRMQYSQHESFHQTFQDPMNLSISGSDGTPSAMPEMNLGFGGRAFGTPKYSSQGYPKSFSMKQDPNMSQVPQRNTHYQRPQMSTRVQQSPEMNNTLKQSLNLLKIASSMHGGQSHGPQFQSMIQTPTNHMMPQHPMSQHPINNKFVSAQKPPMRPKRVENYGEALLMRNNPQTMHQIPQNFSQRPHLGNQRPQNTNVFEENDPNMTYRSKNSDMQESSLSQKSVPTISDIPFDNRAKKNLNIFKRVQDNRKVEYDHNRHALDIDNTPNRNLTPRIIHSNKDVRLETHEERPLVERENFNSFQNRPQSDERNEQKIDPQEVPIVTNNQPVKEMPQRNENLVNIDEMPIASRALTFEELLKQELQQNQDKSTEEVKEEPNKIQNGKASGKGQKKEFLKRKTTSIIQSQKGNNKTKKYTYYKDKFKDGAPVKKQTSKSGNSEKSKSSDTKPYEIKSKEKEPLENKAKAPQTQPKKFLQRGKGVGGGKGNISVPTSKPKNSTPRREKDTSIPRNVQSSIVSKTSKTPRLHKPSSELQKAQRTARQTTKPKAVPKTSLPKAPSPPSPLNKLDQIGEEIEEAIKECESYLTPECKSTQADEDSDKDIEMSPCFLKKLPLPIRGAINRELEKKRQDKREFRRAKDELSRWNTKLTYVIEDLTNIELHRKLQSDILEWTEQEQEMTARKEESIDAAKQIKKLQQEIQKSSKGSTRIEDIEREIRQQEKIKEEFRRQGVILE